ncbi:MAG: hypothetical protein MRJ93_14850 [Nitrososphaeraceae archaeon]|nr:hypothetical protein [Nitrososphaeraceae archaeon]
MKKDNNKNIRKLSFKCYYCDKEFDNEDQYWIHNSGIHPEELKQPNLGMIRIMRDKWGYDIEAKGNPWK